MRRLPPPRPSALPLGAVAILLVATGCTMCPDPFDYVGPVPNGSAPQNDFRLRANGIVPVGSHPVPWPPVVRAEPEPGDGPKTVSVVTESTAAAAEGAPADGDVAVSAEPDPPVAPRPKIVPTVAEATEPLEAGDDVDEAAGPPAPEPPAAMEPCLEEILPPTPPPRPAAVPPLRETPGWKPRA